jgi:C-terminal processing protease CtpA/Prc
VVLVDRASASSAEVFAGALAQSGGALVVGQCTYGKGSSQAVVYQSDGHAVSFTAYTLAVGRRRGRQMIDLSMGVEPQVRWRWRTARLNVLPVANAELERALVTACMAYTAA